MSYTYTELRAMSDGDLTKQHDQKAQHTIVGVDYYLTELNHRVIARHTATMKNLTWVIAGLTGVNVLIVAYSIFS